MPSVYYNKQNTTDYSFVNFFFFILFVELILLKGKIKLIVLCDEIVLFGILKIWNWFIIMGDEDALILSDSSDD